MKKFNRLFFMICRNIFFTLPHQFTGHLRYLVACFLVHAELFPSCTSRADPCSRAGVAGMLNQAQVSCNRGHGKSGPISAPDSFIQDLRQPRFSEMQPVGRDFSRFPVGKTQAGMAQLQRGISTWHGQTSGEGAIPRPIASVSVLQFYDGEWRLESAFVPQICDFVHIGVP